MFVTSVVAPRHAMKRAMQKQRILPFSMRLEPTLKQLLQKWAEAENRNLTNYVETVLREHAAVKSAEEADAKRAKRA